MKIILIGGKGTIGTEIYKSLSTKHQVLIASRSSGDLICDIESNDSIENMFKKSGMVDAVIVAAGRGPFLPLDKLTTEDFNIAIRSKLMGQINTVLIGKKYVNPNGSFTLTSGIPADKPIKQSSAIVMADCGVEGFVRAAALELTQRINCVSPNLVNESTTTFGHLFDGFKTLPASAVAKYYQQCVESNETGIILHAW